MILVDPSDTIIVIVAAVTLGQRLQIISKLDKRSDGEKVFLYIISCFGFVAFLALLTLGGLFT